jgi:hypothetical protein
MLWQQQKKNKKNRSPIQPPHQPPSPPSNVLSQKLTTKIDLFILGVIPFIPKNKRFFFVKLNKITSKNL